MLPHFNYFWNKRRKLKRQEIIEKLLGKMKASESVIISVQKNKWEAKEEYFDLGFDCLYLHNRWDLLYEGK